MRRHIVVNADLKRQFMEENIDLQRITEFFRIPGKMKNTSFILLLYTNKFCFVLVIETKNIYYD